MKLLRLTLILAAVLSVGCAQVTTRTHPDITQSLHEIDTVAVAPPKVEVELLTMTGENERLTDIENRVKGELLVHAKERLVELEYEPLEYDYDEAVASNEEFAYLLSRLSEDFEAAREDIKLGVAMEEKKAAQIRTELGDAAQLLAGEVGADAVLVIRYVGYEKSEGLMARDVAFSAIGLALGAVIVPSFSGGYTEAALIDGTTGDILWADISGGELHGKILNNAMKTLPVDVDPVELSPAAEGAPEPDAAVSEPVAQEDIGEAVPAEPVNS